MNGNVPTAGSSAVPVASPAQFHQDTVEYVGFHVGGQAVVLNLSEHRHLTADWSLDLVNHGRDIRPQLPT
ncbi:hypothetical protein EXE53_11040 [Halorubrum sp. SD626R]|nr:hypothetical protein EXE53_11040 [Halorubrum sp. SD626R]